MYDFWVTPSRLADDAATSPLAYRGRMDAIAHIARIPRRPPRADVIAAAALCAWAILDAIFSEGPGSVAARIVFAVVVTVPLVVRRRWPLAVCAVVAVATALWALAADTAETGTMPFPSILFSLFSVALYSRRLWMAIVGPLMLVGAFVVALTTPYFEDSIGVSDVAIFAFFASGAWTAGWLIRRHATRAQRAYAESDELARTAVIEERARIARELHDVVAHSVSIVAVQAGAAEALLESDPERARQHLAAVRRTAREAMSEMRRALDVLREDDTPHAPQPGLVRLDDLIEDIRSAGVPVELVEDGERPSLSPGLDLVVYRVIQEALTNVRKHAGAVPTEVRLRYRPREIELAVVNDGGASGVAPSTNGAGGGHGLIGMRERVLLFGGRFDAGARDGGGFRVHARLPIEEAA
jgi:signal transduction histidine kinase